MHHKYRILVLGASYGSLLAAKFMLANHDVRLVCLPAEAELINDEGFRVRLPVKGRSNLVEVDSRALPGQVSASGADGADPAGFDLVALAMQEPQYSAPGVRDLLRRVAVAKAPCMSIMNMPPLTYLARITGLATAPLRGCYTDASVWDAFDPALMTLCSPDPQAFRPPEEKMNVLQVSLPTNFKAARFAGDEPTAMLRALARDVEAVRFATPEGPIELPVKLKVHESIFVPLAKWSMLLAGNYRCVQPDAMRSIRDAVHSDLDASRAVYRFVGDVCRALGASDADRARARGRRAQHRAHRPPGAGSGRAEGPAACRRGRDRRARRCLACAQSRRRAPCTGRYVDDSDDVATSTKIVPFSTLTG